MGGWVRTDPERGEIASALHDDVVQGMVAALWTLNAVDGSADVERLQAAIISAQASLERTLAGLRALMERLEPAADTSTRGEVEANG